MKKYTFDCEILQNALLQVLESNGWPNWRAVCLRVYVEPAEPFRTITLADDALFSAQEWVQSASELNAFSDFGQVKIVDENNRSLQTAQRLPGELHFPLTGEPMQPITLNFPDHALKGTAQELADLV